VGCGKQRISAVQPYEATWPDGKAAEKLPCELDGSSKWFAEMWLLSLVTRVIYFFFQSSNLSNNVS